MTDHDALLAAVIANPDEDTPRLAYADWCDENGRPERAEFIRVQIRLERERHSDQVPEWLSHKYDLLRRFGAAWSAGISGEGVREVVFRRGFVEELFQPRLVGADRPAPAVEPGG